MSFEEFVTYVFHNPLDQERMNAQLRAVSSIPPEQPLSSRLAEDVDELEKAIDDLVTRVSPVLRVEPVVPCGVATCTASVSPLRETERRFETAIRRLRGLTERIDL